MSYDNLSSVSQNVMKFYQQLTGEERRVSFFFGRNNQSCFGYGNRLDRCGEGGYILVNCAHSKTSLLCIQIISVSYYLYNIWKSQNRVINILLLLHDPFLQATNRISCHLDYLALKFWLQWNHYSTSRIVMSFQPMISF